jgi:hypothetical protein
VRLIRLDDARAADASLVGAKAAHLATAKLAGLPVLGGFVIPVAEAREAIELGAAELAVGNPGSARARITQLDVDAELAGALAVWGEQLGGPAVVRSSATVESDGVWAGAFASFAEMASDEIAIGVRGCWASVFSADAVKRAAALGVNPRDIGMGVLVQRELNPTYGGVAEVDSAAAVTITAVEGAPAALLSGWKQGEVLAVGSDGLTHPAPEKIPATIARDVAGLCRRVAFRTDCTRIEWAAEDGIVWLLQAQSINVPRDAQPGAIPEGAARDRRLGRLIAAFRQYPGPIGQDFVLPWGFAQLPVVEAPLESAVGREALYECAVSGAKALRDKGLDEERVVGPRTVMRLLDEHAGEELIRAVSSASESEVRRTSEMLGCLVSLGDVLAIGGQIPSADWLWYLDPAQLKRLAMNGDERADFTGRRARTRWDAVLYRLVMAAGDVVEAQPAAPGWGAGPLRFVRTEADVRRVRPGDVIAAVYPLNNLAPLLWMASALVTTEGSAGAHAFEVATWLRVPAVCGAALAAGTGLTVEGLRRLDDAMVAVDGDAGSLAISVG